MRTTLRPGKLQPQREQGEPRRRAAARSGAARSESWSAGLWVSLGGHALVGLGMVAASVLGGLIPACDRGPMIDPNDVMVVEVLEIMPKQSTAMPVKAARAPDPVQGTPDPPAEPTPPVKTDSQLVAPDAQQKEGVEEKPDGPTRDEIMRELRRKEALAALENPTGPEDRLETHADGAEGASGTRMSNGDPLLAAYVPKFRAAVLPNFNPIQTDPGLRTVVLVTVDASGTILDVKVKTSSGSISFDASVRAALQRTGSVPPPPEAILKGSDRISLPFAFTPEDGS